MAVREIYSHPVYQRYKASLCSSSTFFVIAAFLFTLFAPFIIVFWSEGIWKSFLLLPVCEYKIVTVMNVNGSRYVRVSLTSNDMEAPFGQYRHLDLHVMLLRKWLIYWKEFSLRSSLICPYSNLPGIVKSWKLQTPFLCFLSLKLYKTSWLAEGNLG